ncbi:MAG: hypothetical protein KBG20_07120 [Caldilineaceae bacterium]|nr:hypothetical protein [Caldilineaceae bacterium]MBP8106421.1 hypothetical protein [Caldilineaceae bacterium]MBP8123589.1 hypothetical protein [Caldilineaceae bacterium]MBP9072050.1 hypothetical protein [Caldilineaceae bacterium]
MTTASIQHGQSQTRSLTHSQPAGDVMLFANPRSLGRGFSFAQFSGQFWFSYYFGGFTSASRGKSER